MNGMLGFFLVLAATAAAAQSVAPSRDPLSIDMMRSELYMRLSGGPVRIPGQTQFSIIPLTTQSGLGKPADMPMVRWFYDLQIEDNKLIYASPCQMMVDYD